MSGAGSRPRAGAAPPACAACAAAFATAAAPRGSPPRELPPRGAHTCTPRNSRAEAAARAGRTHLAALPPELLVAVLARVGAEDVERAAAALPRAVARDGALWRSFYSQRFGPARPTALRAGTVDWRRAYLDASRRAALRTLLRAAGGRFPLATQTVARVRVVQVGNIRRITSATADAGAAPVVTRGRVARFDWAARQ